MHRTAFCLSLVVLFLASVVPSNAQSESSAAAEGASESTRAGAAPESPEPPEPQSVLMYDVGRNLSIRCHLPADKGASYVWSKNGTAVSELWDVKDRYKLEDGGAVFSISGRALEDDFGNYTCAVGGDAYTWDVQGRPHSKLPPNSNVVEGQKLKLQCKVIGKPYPKVVWLYNNSTDAESTDNGTEVTKVLGSRVRLQRSEQGVEDGELLLEAATRGDAGRYMCVVSDARPLNAATVLRVKDMYAALWPFLGICAEVFVLCAIILVYEKRRTKPELEDSDTDNHDQKKS